MFISVFESERRKSAGWIHEHFRRRYPSKPVMDLQKTASVHCVSIYIQQSEVAHKQAVSKSLEAVLRHHSILI